MATGLQDEKIRQQVFLALQDGDPPFAVYKKTTLGKVLVRYLDPIRMLAEEVVLAGDPESGDLDNTTIKVWSSAEDAYLKRQNKSHFVDGVLIPFTEVEVEEYNVNQISDGEIEEVLQKPFFALKNKLAEFTSPVPVRRFLLMAEKLNRPIGTVNYIKAALEEMETPEDDNGNRINIEL